MSINYNKHFSFPNTCDCLSKNRPSSQHKLKYFFLSSLSIAIITPCIGSPHLIGLLFSGQLLTLCKCGFDTMAPVERTKWMTSTLDHTLNHRPVSIVSDDQQLLWTALVTVSLLWSYSGHFLQAFATSHPTPPLSASHHPSTPLATLAQNWCPPSKKQSEMASNQADNKF